jgi:hypothetical protein
MNKRLIALGLLCLMVGYQLLPAPSQAKDTLLDYLKQHPNATLEYVYPKAQQVASAPVANAKTMPLPSGMPVNIRILDTLSSQELAVGDTIRFSVLNDVIKDGVVLIKAGSMGKATLSVAKKAGYIGRGGKVILSDFSVDAVDGTLIPLTATLQNEGDDKLVASVVLSVLLCPLFLLMKGEQAVLPAGTQKTVYTSAEVQIKVAS